MHVVIITGASDGIGAELGRQYAQSYKAQGKPLGLVLAARSQDKLEQVAQACRAHGAQVLVRPCDVAQQAECQGLIADTLAQFGRIDTLINNAGMSAHALLEDVQDLSWYEQLMRINLWGSVWCTHAALPHIQATKGRVVAVSSLAGLVGVPGRTAYSTTKFAMNGFFEALRAEMVAHQVSVTIAYPGVVDTGIRYRGFNAHGAPAGKSALNESGAMTVAECARIILKGIERRERDIVMTAKGKLGRWIKLMAPSLVDKIALAALKKEVRPH